MAQLTNMASDKEIQDGILQGLYESSDLLNVSWFDRREVVDDTTQSMDDVDQNDVEYSVDILEEERFLERDGMSVRVTARGLERLADIGHDVNLDEELHLNILSELQESHRADPNHPSMDLESLSEELDVSLEVIEENVYYLDAQGETDLDYSNQTPIATITRGGRRRLD